MTTLDGRIGDRYCVASESCALDIIGATRVRDVVPGEMVWIDASGLRESGRGNGARLSLRQGRLE